MTSRLGSSPKGQALAKMLIPSFPVGCRRQTPGAGFLETLVEDHVETRWDDITCITEKGIRTRDGEELEFDAIVCATGFDTSFQPRFPLIGRGGANLAEQWEECPEAYFGLAVPNFPNYFCMFSFSPLCLSASKILLELELELVLSLHQNILMSTPKPRFHRPQFPHKQRLPRPRNPSRRHLHLPSAYQDSNRVHPLPRSSPRRYGGL